MNSRYFAEEIVRMIREQVKASIEIAKSKKKDHDPWDEEYEGVGWISNEVDLFNELYDYEPFKYTIDMTVEDCIDMLSKKPNKYLNGLCLYVLKGGTDNKDIWKIVDQKRKLTTQCS